MVPPMIAKPIDRILATGCGMRSLPIKIATDLKTPFAPKAHPRIKTINNEKIKIKPAPFNNSINKEADFKAFPTMYQALPDTCMNIDHLRSQPKPMEWLFGKILQ